MAGQSPYPDPNADASASNAGAGALEALRKLRQAAGIQPGSVIDTAAKGVVNAPAGIGKGIGGMWDSLSKAPTQQPPGDMQAPPGAPAGVPNMGMGGPNLGAATPPPSNQVMKLGWSGAPMDSSGAISALQNLSAQDEEPYIPTEELYKHAFADPATMQSGAPQAAQQQLGDRLHDQDFMKNLQEKATADISGAQTGLNPTVQAGAEAAARRATYPAQVAGQAEVESAKINNEYPSAMAKMLLGQGGQGAQNGLGANGIRSFSKTGMTFNPTQQVPPTLLTALQKAQAAAGGMDVFGSNAANLRRTQQDVLNSMQGLSPKVKMGMMQILANPQAPVDESQYSDEEKQQMEYIHSFLGLQ